MTSRVLATAAALLLAIPGLAAAGPEAAENPALVEMQTQFAAAYNRGDADAMAAAFTKDAVRVTPSGIFQGRDAIRTSFAAALKLGLHDYAVQRTISRSYGGFIFNSGTWSARLGDRPFHGYYTAIVVDDGGQPKIMEETVTVASP